MEDCNWATYFTNFNFSWELSIIFEHNIAKYPIILETIRRRGIKYFIYTDINSNIKNKVEAYLDIEHELIPYLYNQNVFHQNGITIFSI